MLDTYSLSNISCLITKAWTAKIRPRDPHWKKKYRILLIKLTLSEIRRWTENINWSLYISGIYGHRKGQKYIWTKSIVIWFNNPKHHKLKNMYTHLVDFMQKLYLYCKEDSFAFMVIYDIFLDCWIKITIHFVKMNVCPFYWP